jgi:outer membrane protein assembly factor BamE (lipoprotein component of BamABCDE complex)
MDCRGPTQASEKEPAGRKAMTAKWALPAVAFTLCWIAASAGYCANTAADPGQDRDFSAATLAKVTPGETTKTQIEALLGQPWRTTFSDDADEPGPVVWEYRGQDPNGTYRVHIEFDSHNITTLIAKIPDSTGEAPARVAKTPPRPGKP